MNQSDCFNHQDIIIGNGEEGGDVFNYFISGTFSSWYSEYMTADISHFKVFFIQTPLSGKWLSILNLCLESPTNSTYSRGSFSIRTSVTCALSPKRSKKKYKGTVCFHDSFLCLVKLNELTFKYKKKLKCLKCLKKSHAWP